MILTLTLNPSIDISYSLDQINLDTVNRVNKTIKTARRKGIKCNSSSIRIWGRC